MTSGPSLDSIIGERRAAAERTLADAVRIDVARFLDSEIEARLLAREHFRERFPPQALAQLRRDLDALAERLAASALRELTDLRVWFGANPASDAEEAEAVARVLEPVEAAVEELLRTYAFPDDGSADVAGASAPVDLDAAYVLDYRPSPNLVWAWRRLRAIDTARNQLADEAGGPREPSFELRFFLPEALPPLGA